MSEAVEAPESIAGTGPSAGQLLRQAREAAGLHVATLAVALKVPVRKLEALEEDRYDLLPDAVFVRALASSVCRTLKIDSQPVLERLPQMSTPRLLHRDDGINTPFRGPGEGPKQAWPPQVSKPVLATVFALLLAAVVLVFLPPRNDEPVASVATTAKTPAQPAPASIAPGPAVGVGSTEAPPAAVAPGSPAGVAASAPVQMAAPVASPPALTATPAMSFASAPAFAASVARPTASAAVAAASAPATPASGTIVFHTTGESWVKVTDANGASVMQKLMKAGDSEGASGALPLTVTVGSAKATTVEVRGQPFDLAPHMRDNVARFQVK